MLTMHSSSFLLLCVAVKSLVIVTLRHCDPRVALKGYAARWRMTDVTPDSGARSRTSMGYNWQARHSLFQFGK